MSAIVLLYGFDGRPGGSGRQWIEQTIGQDHTIAPLTRGGNLCVESLIAPGFRALGTAVIVITGSDIQGEWLQRPRMVIPACVAKVYGSSRFAEGAYDTLRDLPRVPGDELTHVLVVHPSLPGHLRAIAFSKPDRGSSTTILRRALQRISRRMFRALPGPIECTSVKGMGAEHQPDERPRRVGVTHTAGSRSQPETASDGGTTHAVTTGSALTRWRRGPGVSVGRSPCRANGNAWGDRRRRTS